MNSYSLSVELTALQGAQLVTSQDNRLCLVVPIEEADLNLFQGKDGRQRVYLPLSMWASRDADPATGVNQYGKSHDIQQSYSQAKRASLPQGTYPPRIGNAKPIVKRSQQNAQANVYAQPAPTGYAPVNPVTAPGAQTPNNDLAF
jgi:hypothetical protein